MHPGRVRAMIGGFAVTCLGFVGSRESLSARQSHMLTVAGGPATHPAEAKEVYFYVSTEGSDTWSGRAAEPNRTRTDGPFRTLARARDAVRQMKVQHTLSEPVTVFVRQGRYDLAAPLIFTPDDSGTNRAPVVYAAYPGEVPMVSGGREIAGWKPATGAKLPAAHGVWMTDVPEVKEGKWYFHELFVNGGRRQRARSPNTGFFRVDGKVSAGNPAQFKYHDADLQPQWARQDDVEVVGLQKWAEFRLPIRTVDDTQHTVILAQGRQTYADEPNARYWVENTPDALDVPGEWYLDRHHGVLYYIPLPGEDMTRIQVIAPALVRLVGFEGDIRARRYVENITLRGLTFAFADWSMPPSGYVDVQAAYDVPAAIDAEAAHSCTIEKCVLVHLGSYAVALRRGSKRDRIVDNEMTDAGAGGVKIGDPKGPRYEEEATSENLVSDNHIHDIGIVYPAAVGVWIGESSDNVISHNEINDTYYTGISVGWTWGYGHTAAHGNVVTFNSIHDIGRGLLNDLGCIYTLGVQPGTLERNNVCHDVSRYEYGGWGIYTDEGSSKIRIENNIVYRTEDGSFHQHYGRDNVVRNNVFALGRRAQIRRTRAEPRRSFRFEHNIVYWTQGRLFDGRWDDHNYYFDHNLYYCAGGGAVEFGRQNFIGWQKLGQDRHSLIGDPLFVDPERGDFSLREGSLARRAGFRPIDVRGVGPRH